MTRAAAGPGAVRIAAGLWKGRRLEIPAAARPTSSRAREALFDILGPRVEGARVLDLHAGSGAVGLEALSRGAMHAVLVDRDAATLARNTERIGAERSVEILEADAGTAIERLAARGDLFDVIFSDPPYAGEADAPRGIAALLAQDGVLVLQRDTGAAESSAVGLVLVRERRYGRNVFHFFSHSPEPAR
jgi:16S rRNA (guanine966-N2)-methyltransferase